MSERTLVLSADHHALRKVRDLDPDVPTVARLGSRILAPEALEPRGRLSGVCLPADLVATRDVSAVREAGLACYVEIVNDPQAARQLAEWGVTGLVTDRPDLLGPVLERVAGGVRPSTPEA